MPSRENIIKHFRSQVEKARARAKAHREAQELPPLTSRGVDPGLDGQAPSSPQEDEGIFTKFNLYMVAFVLLLSVFGTNFVILYSESVELDPIGIRVRYDHGTQIHINCQKGSSPAERDPALANTVVLVETGAGESSYWWQGIQEELSEAGLHVCTYDRPGYRQSPTSIDFSASNVTREMNLLAESKRLLHFVMKNSPSFDYETSRFVLLAHGFGALVARSLAEREASGKVIAIAMVDPLAEQSLAELPDQPFEAEFVPSRLRSIRMHAIGARSGLTRVFLKMGMHSYSKLLLARVRSDIVSDITEELCFASYSYRTYFELSNTMDVIKNFNRLDKRGTEKARAGRKRHRLKIPVLILSPTTFGNKNLAKKEEEITQSKKVADLTLERHKEIAKLYGAGSRVLRISSDHFMHLRKRMEVSREITSFLYEVFGSNKTQSVLRWQLRRQAKKADAAGAEEAGPHGLQGLIDEVDETSGGQEEDGPLSSGYYNNPESGKQEESAHTLLATNENEFVSGYFPSHTGSLQVEDDDDSEFF